MAAVHGVLSSLPRKSVSSVGKDGCGGGFPSSTKLLSRCVSDSLSIYRVGLWSVTRLKFGGEERISPVNKFSSLRSYGQFSENDRKGFPATSRSVYRGLTVSCYMLFNTPSARVDVSRSVKSRARLGGDGDLDIFGDSIDEDYYSVLGLTPDATPDEIKKAYYSCMKACHPDLSGNASSVTEFCMFVNEVYEVLSDPEQRMIYDEINGYTITGINPFKDAVTEKDHTFVDEFTCIGCKNCANTAPKTFDIEESYGRARVMSQVGNPALVEMAIQTCPVDCIYWVTPAQLTLLEDEMRIVERVNVGMMLSGMGNRRPDVFGQASWKWEKRQAKAMERALAMMKANGKTGKESWWKQWDMGGEENSKADADKFSRERAAKAAAAARRWREYSRQGVDRRAMRKLASTSGSDTAEEEDSLRERAGAK